VNKSPAKEKVLTEQDVTVISAINFYTKLNVPSSDTATDSMTYFEKVDRVRRRHSADTCLFWLPSGSDKICRSYSDLNFCVTFFGTVLTVFTNAYHQTHRSMGCICVSSVCEANRPM